ncbi:NAD/NADP octopine/nopaline dehydrogenase family protein [Anaerovorax odorimutans]|uniref:NAD/NADP octopine/nopaline dehydrogenase family protein n=1 Tax=Anaerovorax odorimutans TaxID=109327 RepID=A0ABT1RJC4_9FIRM|nr:NAD/NADP-dependent octopine/nopaline dehydrogenase family protein [Anaerovorax odorimutans]MCQ4635287.1 NAD/NADP octopine/nopaline dehydrogenase family protein [Anaerovorax odorimutans]
MKVTVIGCGNGAFAVAADLSSRGHQITLYVDPSHKKNFEVIEKTKVIHCVGKELKGDISIYKVTTNIEEALIDVDLIMPVVPSFAHEDIAKSLVPYVNKKHKILLAPGSTGGALVFAKVFANNKIGQDVRISEMHTLPYVARRISEDSVDISLFVKKIYFSTFPAIHNREMYDLVRQLYNGIVMVTDVLETGLNNGNLVIHPAPVILNAGKIEYYGKHYHYKEGITPSVGKVIQKIDDERKLICRAFGYKEIDMKQRLYEQGDCELKDTVYETVQTSTDILVPLEGPNNLDSRYLVEDTSYTLVAAISLAEVAGVETPLMKSILYLANALKDEDYMKTGRNLKRMGLENKTVEDIKAYLKFG